MHTRYLWWVFAVFVLLASCISTADRPNSLLLRADSLIKTDRADSALQLLETVNPLDFTTGSDEAWYALLLTQAKDKNYITQTDDSLIRIAIEYFDHSNDMLQRAKAHYYRGRIFQEKGEVEETLHEFLTTSALMENIDDYELNILLKNNLGLLFWDNNLPEEADSLYKQTVELTEAHRDTLRWVITLVSRADIYIEKGKDYYAVADTIMNQALRLVNEIEDRHAKSLVFSTLSYLCDYQDRSQEVISYAHQGLKYTSDNSAEKGYYLVLGSAYTLLAEYDSATVYLERSLDTDSYYTRAGAYMRLSEVASALGNKDDALKYEKLYSVYKDSMQLVEQPVKVISTLKNALHSQSVNRYESFLIRTRFYWLLTGGLLFVSICLYLYKRKKENAELMKLKTKRQTLYVDIAPLKMELLQKEQKIESLQKHCEQLEADTDQKRQMDNCLQELLGQYRQIHENLERQLNEKNKEVMELRRINLKSVLGSSPIYAKLLELCKYNRRNLDKMRKISPEEWAMLLHEIDVVSLGFVERLQNKYEYLSEEDIHFCCLVKLEFKYADIAFLWGCSTDAVYKRSNSVLERMGVADRKKAALKNVLDQI